MRDAAQSSFLQFTDDPLEQHRIDARLKASVMPIAPGAKITASGPYFTNFTTTSKRQLAGIYKRGRANCICDVGETFTDDNANRKRDADGGSDDQGGTSNVALIRYTVNYPRLFPTAHLCGCQRTSNWRVTRCSATSHITNSPCPSANPVLSVLPDKLVERRQIG